MMNRPALLARRVAVVCALAACSTAGASPELARQKLCMGCHAVDRKMVGPSFKAIAERYAGQPGAQARMEQKIIHGGSGAWGAVPMPANPRVSPDEARALAAWVLATK